MKEWIANLNDYAGLIALLALVATILVPYVFYKIECKNKHKEMQDEYDAMNELRGFPMSNSDRERYEKKRVLEKRLKK